MQQVRRAAVWVVVAASLVAVGAGCLETEVALGPVEQAKVDPRLVGDWKTTGEGEAQPVKLLVRNFNGREYYIEQREPDGRIIRYAGHIVELKGAPFVHVRELTDDGTLVTKHVILRVDRVGDAKVHLRQLNDSFFADKPHDTTEKLRAIVEQNLDNASMYDGDPLVLTRGEQ